VQGSNDLKVNPDSFAAQNPDWYFGDGGVADNPYTTSLIKEYFVQLVTWEAQHRDAGVYASYEDMVNAIISQELNDTSVFEDVGGLVEVFRSTGDRPDGIEFQQIFKLKPVFIE
jgi:hypothetical protein